MESKPVEELTKVERETLCMSYAALLLFDADLEVTSEKLTKVLESTGNNVDPATVEIFAKAMEG